MSWQMLPFTSVFNDVTGGNIKTQQRDFLPTGEIPVVDQGQDLVAGYVNERSYICKASLPVIVFGDHTRAVKYVDFEFAMGADGIKVLVARVESDIKYLYYVLKSLDIPSAGYSRHFKFLKEVKIPLPPLAEQQRIAAILDAADGLRARRRASLAELDTLLQSTFLEMFGDPVTNPMRWEVGILADLVKPTDRINYGVVQPGEERHNGVPLIRVGDFVGGELNLSEVKRISPEIEVKYRRSRLNGRELLISCVGSIGCVCKVSPESAGYNIARAVARVPLRDCVSNDFMLYCLRSEAVQRHFKKETRTVSQPTLNIALIKTAPVVKPPLDLQRRFATIVESVEAQKARLRAHLAELDGLFASLQARAFNGEL